MNSHEQIIEIMSDTAGESSDRLHLLRLAQMIFHKFAHCNIAGVHDDAVYSRVVQAVITQRFQINPRIVRFLKAEFAGNTLVAFA